MILQRFAKALKQQDWTTVVLEFSLVVLGIVIGFQVNEWGKAQQAAANEPAVQIELRDALRDGLV